MDVQSPALSVTRNKETSKRWHEAWGTPQLEPAYRDCLHDDFQTDVFGQGKVDKPTYMTRDTEFLTASDPRTSELIAPAP